jgi:hypothetical protein
MTNQLKRRDFLMGCAAVGGAATAGGFTCVELASAAPIDVPVVDKLSIRVLVDGSQNLFQRPAKVGNVSIEPRHDSKIIAAPCTISGAYRSTSSRSAATSCAPSCSTSATPRRL